MKHKKPAIAGYPGPDGPKGQGYLQQDGPATGRGEPDLRQGPSRRNENEQYAALKAKLKSTQALIETVARKVSVSVRRIVKTGFRKTTWFIGLTVTLCFALIETVARTVSVSARRIVKTGFWKTAWFIGLAVTLCFVLAADTDPLRRLEWKAYDLGMRSSSARPANKNIVVIAIDDASFDKFGPWPWSRAILAEVNTRLAAARPAVIGYTLSFELPQNRHGLTVLRKLRKTHRKAFGKTATSLLRKAVSQLATDYSLAASFKRAGNVVLAIPYRSVDESTSSVPDLPKSLRIHALDDVRGSTDTSLNDWLRFLHPNREFVVGELYAPLSAIGRSAVGLSLGTGHLQSHDSVRAMPLVLSYGDQYLPSFPLLMTAHSLGLRRTDIQVELANGVKLGEDPIAADSSLQAYPFFYKTRDGESPFKVFSFADVKQKKIARAAFRNKTVLIGLTGPRLARTVQTPIGESMAPVMVMAHTISSLLNGDLYRVPKWGTLAQIAAFMVVAFYLMFVLTRFRISTGLAFTALLLLALLNVEFILMTSKSIWVPLMVPAVALVFGQLVLARKQFVDDSLHRYKMQLSEADRMLGQLFQSQGRLDTAFTKFRQCIADDSLLEQLYSLGLDYERKRQYNKAAEAFRYIKTHNPQFRDCDEHIQRNNELGNVLVSGRDSSNSTAGTLVLNRSDIQNPMVGRYQLEKELGKGEMGTVYLGTDPKIGRTVAIKTMELWQGFEGEQLEEIKQRFFREAETAGRLNHPNIVTVHDVGEEQDLAYIAMDHLQGKDLSAYCRPDSLLPIASVLEIAIQVAEALEYAHGQNVVHRDIKPANIIYDRRGKTTATITDFGVACLTDNSKTKTGTILGSPSYMSPEQLAGKKVDGRSDLFSLGVTLYELLTGKLPFSGDSLSSLVYQIVNEKHPDVRKRRSDLPSCVSSIIDKALHKDVEKRYQSGEQMAKSIRRCRKQV